MPNLLDRLRSRKVIQWALAYLAGAWLVLQVLELLAEVYGWPPRILRLGVPLLAVGLLATLVLAWFHGEQGQQRASGIGLGMLAGVVVLAGAAVAMVGGTATAPADVAVDTDATGPPAPDESSIAVLPFVNMSPEPEQEYFSDGITEELLHALAKLPGLYVPARTSSFAFKGRAAPVQEIARQLRVAHVLEGSVRKSGDQVRITVQLIDARDGGHLWSEAYDRELRDIFAIQEEIARSIVEVLRSRLAIVPEPGEELIRRGTSNVAAYQAYLRGLAAFNERRNRDAIEALEQALALDPEFARAHAFLAATYAAAVGSSAGWVDRDEGLRLAEAAARRALELDPSLAMPHSSMGLMYTNARRWAAAEAEHRAAVSADPASADAHHWLGWHLVAVGRLDDAVQHLRLATRLDPLAATIRRNYGIALGFAGRREEARTQLEFVDSLTSGRDGFALATYALLAAEGGDTAEARQLLPSRVSTDPIAAATLAVLGDTVAARSALDTFLRDNPHYPRPSFAAMGYVALGDDKRAIDLLELALDRDDPAMFFVLRSPMFDPLRGHPRLRRLLEQAGLES